MNPLELLNSLDDLILAKILGRLKVAPVYLKGVEVYFNPNSGLNPELIRWRVNNALFLFSIY